MAEYTMYRGDTLQLGIQVLDAKRKPLPNPGLLGTKIWMTAKRQLSDADVNAIFQVSTDTGDVIITDPAQCTATIIVPAVLTIGLTQDVDLFYDIQVRLPTALVFTIERGVIHVLADVTRAIA